MLECLFIAVQTSLIHAILKELPLTNGSIVVGGSISYASQEPWLFIASVQQNILFGQPMDRNRYRQVVRACALEQDFRQLPHGDRTIVGERGITLSGGQKARISLARCVTALPLEDLFKLQSACLYSCTLVAAGLCYCSVTQEEL